MTGRRIVGALLLGTLVALVLLGLQEQIPTTGTRIDSAGALEATPHSAPTDRAPVIQPTRQTREIPEKALNLLAQLEARHGEPLPGYVGGRTFRIESGDCREDGITSTM